MLLIAVQGIEIVRVQKMRRQTYYTVCRTSELRTPWETKFEMLTLKSSNCIIDFKIYHAYTTTMRSVVVDTEG